MEKYFKNIQPIQKTIHVRGGKEIVVLIKSAGIHVCAHKKKRFVIAIKYTGEKDYRYLVASDLTWRYADIINAFTLRWLAEVFIQDHKANEGWGNLTRQPGEDGSYRRSSSRGLLPAPSPLRTVLAPFNAHGSGISKAGSFGATRLFL
ncbi:hypothetical protein [Desulfonema ishimotonii]|uniref:hypothetical protein n=1 Tax=Desulfonema ishimotonii TaxID=45657 RepID=UPI001E5C0B13|nr:hypothetical protein [Desulfonema ishimotonii]